jgi:uncharacterized glyoxalase superfamily protein PhnB
LLDAEPAYRHSLEVIMNEPSPLTEIGQPVAELPVADVERAQEYYCAHLGFAVAWLWPDKSMGAVTRGEAAIFLRRKETPFQSASLWLFAPDVHATFQELERFGANIFAPLENKPWGLTQFTVADLDGHQLHFHHDL